MENRSNGTGEELAQAKAKLYGFPSSARPTRNAPPQELSDPSIEIELENNVVQFQPGDFLKCEYNIALVAEHEIQAIETSVIWLTEGKGDTDIGVHLFERRQKQSLTTDTFNSAQRISTVLPASPLSYEGNILKIRWCVRVRLFLLNGNQVTEDHYFQLGRVQPFCAITLEQSKREQLESESNEPPNESKNDSADKQSGTGAA